MSTLTLTKTKSHCKSRTVLDYIAETLLSNDVDQEASGDGCASSGKSKTGRETLNFVSELPDLEAASRLPIGELCTQVTQLASALQAAKHELTAVKAAQQKGQQPLGGRTTQSRAAAAAASFSSASEEAKAGDPRAALMAMIQKRVSGQRRWRRASRSARSGSPRGSRRRSFRGSFWAVSTPIFASK